MPLLDGRSRDIVLRIVYDGAPEAGKTTNLQQLCERISLQRRGQLQAPGTAGVRTMFFDWLDVTGGYVAGRRVRCQLVTVPGQASRLRRRKYLLRAADAVVFVCDARRDFVDENRRHLEQLQRVLRRAVDVDDPPVDLVLQANKQDLDGALDAAALRAALGLDPETPAVSAEAHAGSGVMEAFTLGVRLAVDRVRAFVAGAGLERLGQTTEQAEDLYRELGSIDEEPDRADGLERIAAAARAVAPPEPEPEPEPPPLPLPNLPAGQIWPPVRGRAAIASLNGEAEMSSRARAWAPDDAIEIRCGTWTLHTRGAWQFQDVDAGRAVLVESARRHVRLGPLLPEGRSIALGADRDSWRLWVLTREVETIEDELERVIAAGDAAATANAVCCAVRATLAVRQRAIRERFGVDLGLAQVAMSRAAITYLGAVRDDVDPPSDETVVAALWDELAALLPPEQAARAAVANELARSLRVTTELTDEERDVVVRLVS